MAERNIKIFNKNFYCKDMNSITELYKKKDDISLFNNNVLFRSEKFLHPLFLNYNYCLFCYNRRKTKYFSNNLIKYHNDEVNILTFMKNKKIKLKKAKNKKEKIVRRFTHSFDTEKINIVGQNFDYKKIIHFDSDTELYVDKAEINYENKLIYNNENEEFDIKNININYSINNTSNNKTISSKNLSFNSEESSNSEEITLEKINLNINEVNKKRKKTFNYPSFPLTKLKSSQIKSRSNLDNNKFLCDTKNIKLNKSSDLLIISEDNINPNPGYLSIIKNFALKNFKIFKKSSANNNINSKDFSNKKKSIISMGLNNNYELRNENCSICLQEIRDKFTLTCGDFFCKECITQVVKNCMIDISRFDKMVCPLCNELIEENTLKKLLTEEEFEFYQKTSTRIKGIKDKNLIPCPYPDCEGFADKNSNNKNNIYCCQNNHLFCGKCKEIIQNNYEREGKKHKCSKKYDETLKYLHSQKNIKKCPNCGCWVQKEQNGCNNMTCSNIWCKFEFCWICRHAYDETHYKNPLSMCFGLSSSDPDNNFTRGKGIRFIRCILIFLLIIFIIMPFVIVLFSIIEMFVYIIIFVLDGSALKYIRLKTKYAHKLFYKIAILVYFWLSLALIPVGYISLFLIIISLPFICLIKRAKREDEYD